MQLHVDTKNYKLTAALVPDALGNKAYMGTPCHTPWRTIIVSNKASDILESKLILNLNEPSKIENTDWIKPMKFVGVWWEMQTGKSTWNYSNRADTVETEVNLVHENGRGQRIGAKRAAQGIARRALELGIDQFVRLLRRVPVAGLCRVQQIRQVLRPLHSMSHCDGFPELGRMAVSRSDGHLFALSCVSTG